MNTRDFGPCLCGDTACPSCGTAQGTLPEDAPRDRAADLVTFADRLHEAAVALQAAEDAWPTDAEGYLVPTGVEIGHYPEGWPSFDEVCSMMAAWASSAASKAADAVERAERAARFEAVSRAFRAVETADRKVQLTRGQAERRAAMFGQTGKVRPDGRIVKR